MLFRSREGVQAGTDDLLHRDCARMHPSFPCAPSPRLLRWHVRGEPPRLSTSLIIWGTAPFFNIFPHTFPHNTPPLHPLYAVKHPRSYVRKHNMLCLQQSRDAICSSPAFNLNLQVDLEANLCPFTRRSHRPPKLPRQRHARPTGASAQDKRWGGPQIADTRTKPRHDNLGSVPH